jgi:hypothetical protein
MPTIADVYDVLSAILPRELTKMKVKKPKVLPWEI